MLFNPEKLIALYWYCAIIGTLVFILKTALPYDSGDGAGSSDAAFGFFTIESVAAFFMCGGWMGWFAFSQLHYELKISMISAIISGILGMLFFSFLISKFKNLEHIPAADIKEVENKTGEAYLQFKPKGRGKIRIEYNSKLEILDAKNDTDKEIKAFEPIKVIKVENGTIYIKGED